MKFESGHVYHVYNQGNNKQQLFKTHDDYKQFLIFVQSYITPCADILSWCLLPNHFHFMLSANEKSIEIHRQGNLTLDILTNGFRKLLSAYAHDFNKRNNQSGSLFRPKTKAKDLSIQQLKTALNANDYYINCFYYIHQNPLRHKIVSDLRQWIYSSFRFYAGERQKDMCNKPLASNICDYNDATFSTIVYNRLPDDLLDFFEGD